MLKIQHYKHKTPGFRTFSCFGHHIWNSLPQDLSRCSTMSSFKAKLKTSFCPNISNQFLLVIVCVCVRMHVCACVCAHV